MKIAVIGCGYVGLVTGACFADMGNEVICVDVNESKIQRLKTGEIPIFETGLSELVERGQDQKRLFFTTDLKIAVEASDLIFLCVGTPALANKKGADLFFLKTAVQQISKVMNGYKIIINKSTVPIGTHLRVTDWLSQNTKEKFHVVSNPEFLKEGTAVENFCRPDRVIIGTDSHEVYSTLAELYEPFVKNGNSILWMDPTSAEISKYASNSFLATKISFMNELSLLCEKTGGDIEEVRRAMSKDERIGKHFLYAGPGYGGSCFPKDVEELIQFSEGLNVDLGIVRATDKANQKQKNRIIEKIISVLGADLTGLKMGLWGLSFKPNTDDVRESPAASLVENLLLRGAKVTVYDPVANERFKELFYDRVRYGQNSYEPASGADALILMTEWNEFKQIDLERVRSLMTMTLFFDARNVFNSSDMKELGFQYFGIGRP